MTLVKPHGSFACVCAAVCACDRAYLWEQNRKCAGSREKVGLLEKKKQHFCCGMTTWKYIRYVLSMPVVPEAHRSQMYAARLGCKHTGLRGRVFWLARYSSPSVCPPARTHFLFQVQEWVSAVEMTAVCYLWPARVRKEVLSAESSNSRWRRLEESQCVRLGHVHHGCLREMLLLTIRYKKKSYTSIQNSVSFTFLLFFLSFFLFESNTFLRVRGSCHFKSLSKVQVCNIELPTILCTSNYSFRHASRWVRAKQTQQSTKVWLSSVG